MNGKIVKTGIGILMACVISFLMPFYAYAETAELYFEYPDYDGDGVDSIMDTLEFQRRLMPVNGGKFFLDSNLSQQEKVKRLTAAGATVVGFYYNGVLYTQNLQFDAKGNFVPPTKANTQAAAATAVNAAAVTKLPAPAVFHTKQAVAFYSEPNAAAKKIGTIENGKAVTVTGSTADGYLQLLFPDGGVAYAPASGFTAK